MAELLIKARDPVDLPKDEESRERCYRRGDIVVVMKDGHEWGKEERLPKFVVVKIPGLDVEKARHLIEPCYTDTGLIDLNGEAILKLTARRKWKVLVDTVPTTISKELAEKGIVEVSWDNIKSYVYDKLTTQTAEIK